MQMLKKLDYKTRFKFGIYVKMWNLLLKIMLITSFIAVAPSYEFIGGVQLQFQSLMCG
jgi:hypothetical protein